MKLIVFSFFLVLPAYLVYSEKKIYFLFFIKKECFLLYLSINLGIMIVFAIYSINR